jgi:hypothetical protein
LQRHGAVRCDHGRLPGEENLVVDIVIYFFVGCQADMVTAIARAIGEHRRGMVRMVGNPGIQVAPRIGRAIGGRSEARSARGLRARERGSAGAARQAGHGYEHQEQRKWQ